MWWAVEVVPRAHRCETISGQRREKKGKMIIAEWIPKEPKHFLRARPPEGGAGLEVPGQRGLEGQDLVAERQVQPTGFVGFQEHRESSPLPSPYSSMVSQLGSVIRPWEREGQQKEEASEPGLAQASLLPRLWDH